MPKGANQWKPLPAEKRCIDCKAVKPQGDFAIVNYTTGTGKRSQKMKPNCKACQGLRDAKRYVAHPHVPHGLEKPKYCRVCKSTKPAVEFGRVKRSSGEVALYSNCKSCVRERGKKYVSKHRVRRPVDYAIYGRQWYIANKERIRIRNQEFRKANPEKMRARYIAAIYKRKAFGCDKKNPEVRRAIEATLESYRIGDQYWDVYESKLIDKPTIDHIVPLSAGGDNSADNFTVTSLSNNSSKNKLPLTVWLTKRVAA